MFLCPIEDLLYVERRLEPIFENLKGLTIFISGSTGFIGKCLVETLVWLNRSKKLNLNIHSISRSPESFFAKYPHFRAYEEFHLLKGDIRDRNIPFKGSLINVLIHAATDVVDIGSPLDLYDSCAAGTSNILSFAKLHSCEKFLLLSSGAVYGKFKDEFNGFSESYVGGIDLRASKSAYGLGKQASEWIVQQSSGDMNVTIARCFAFVGPYLPINSHFAIGNFINDVLKNKSIEIKGDGTPLRTYLYTSDLCLWLIKILLEGKTGEVFNVGASEVISIANLAALVKDLSHSDCEIIIGQKEGNCPFDAYIPNIQYIADRFGFYPNIDLRQSIQKTLNWNKLHETFY